MLVELAASATVYASLRARGEITRRASSRSGPALIVKEVRSAHVSAADVGVAIAVDGVRARFSDHVQDDAAGLAIFGVVVIGDDLEFLYLFHSGAESVPHGSRHIRNISAVNVMDNAAAVDHPRADDFRAQSGVVCPHAWRRIDETLPVIRRTGPPAERCSRGQVGYVSVIEIDGNVRLGRFDERNL